MCRPWPKDRSSGARGTFEPMARIQGAVKNNSRIVAVLSALSRGAIGAVASQQPRMRPLLPTGRGWVRTSGYCLRLCRRWYTNAHRTIVWIPFGRRTQWFSLHLPNGYGEVMRTQDEAVPTPGCRDSSCGLEKRYQTSGSIKSTACIGVTDTAIQIP